MPMTTPRTPKRRRTLEEMMPEHANRQSLQDAQDQFDLVESNPELAKALQAAEERPERQRKKK